MNPNDMRGLQLRGLGVWILTLVLLMGISSILPDWLINLFLVLVGLAILAPIAGFLGLRWWLQRNLIQTTCPVCAAPVSGFQNTNTQCQSCGEPLQLKDGKALRITPPGTVDVKAVEVMTVEATTLKATTLESTTSESTTSESTTVEVRAIED